MTHITNSLEEFLVVLREHEIITFSKFVCIKSEKAFTEEKFTPTKKMRLQWCGDMPQYLVGRRRYACHQGKDKNLLKKKQYAEKRDSKEFTQRRNLKQPTKKLGCPVLIHVSRVLTLPNFKVSKVTSWEKQKMAEKIKTMIEMGEDIGGENVYRFNLPDETSHQNHAIGSDAAAKEVVDPVVRWKIKDLVYQGEGDIPTITALTEQFVANELGETDKSRTRFYPNIAIIRNIIYSVKREMGLDTKPVRKNKSPKRVRKNNKKRSKVEKENSDDLSDTYSEQNNSEICTQQEDSEGDCEEYQTQRQKHELISECNSTIASLQSVMWLLGEQYLEKLRNDLQLLHQEATLHVDVGQDTLLTVATPNSSSMKTKAHYQNPKAKRKKLKEFGQTADTEYVCFEFLKD